MKKLGILLKKIIFIILLIYVVVTFIKQQKILNSYKEDSKVLDEQISKANEYQRELNEKKENINSEEYIEQMAREKLDMYMPDETVYINSEY